LTVWTLKSDGGRPALGIAVFVLALVLVGMIAALTALREPGYSLALNVIDCQHQTHAGRPLEAFHPVSLPHTDPPAWRGADVVLACRFEVDGGVKTAANDAVLIPSFAETLAIEANGNQVALVEVYGMRKLRFVSLPAFAPLPPSATNQTVNRFSVRVTGRPGLPLNLGTIYLGPRETLRAFYQTRWFASAVLPTIVVGGNAALAIVFLLIWAQRRHESEYGWLALLLLIGAAHGSVLIPDFGIGSTEKSFWNWLVIWESAALLMFIRSIAGIKDGRRTWLFFLPPLGLTLFILASSTSMARAIGFPAGILIIVAQVALGLISLGRAAARRNREALVMLLGMTMIFAFLLHDFWVILSGAANQIFLARPATAALVLTLCTAMTLRFTRAMRAADATAESLRVRVEAAEAELRVTYEELRVRREAEAVERERGRLMRDLHDGVGGDLASMLALADAPEPHPAEIAAHARSALADMRLIIASLEDYGGDLTLALGAWRERLDPLIRSAGLTLDWRVDDLPPLPGLGPAQVLDVLRIVQEAVTNVLKHAQASRIVLAAYESGPDLAIAIRDDGIGLGEQTGGNGLRNMALRAERLGGAVAVSRLDGETSVVLTIPRSS
jgi:two-component system sensor histidine kinase UhpB